MDSTAYRVLAATATLVLALHQAFRAVPLLAGGQPLGSVLAVLSAVGLVAVLLVTRVDSVEASAIVTILSIVIVGGWMLYLTIGFPGIGRGAWSLSAVIDLIAGVAASYFAISAVRSRRTPEADERAYAR